MVLAPSISSFIAISSLCLSSMSDIFSPGILLTAPMPMFTTVTAKEVVISLFSEASPAYGFHPGEKYSIHTGNNPCQTNVGPALLSHKDKTRGKNNFTSHFNQFPIPRRRFIVFGKKFQPLNYLLVRNVIIFFHS